MDDVLTEWPATYCIARHPGVLYRGAHLGQTGQVSCENRRWKRQAGSVFEVALVRCEGCPCCKVQSDDLPLAVTGAAE